jgi:Ca-activated chloride channel family protein
MEGAVTSLAATQDAAPQVRHKQARHFAKIPVGDGQGPDSFAPMPRPYEQRQPPPAYFGRDNFEHKEVNQVKLVSEEPVSTFSIDVDTSSYSFVRKSLNSGHLPQKDAVRVEEMINYFDYNYKTPHDSSKPFLPTVAVYPTPWNPKTKLLHIGIKGLDIERHGKPRTNLVFLIDVSGSMDSPERLPLLKQSFKLLVDSLEPDDTVAIVVYAGAAGTVLEPTYANENGMIKAAIDRLHAGGSTAGGEGIRQAYALAEQNYDRRAVNRVILATDGDFNVGITNAEELKGFVERERNKGIYLSVLGVGMGNYNDQMMQKLAQNGNGNAAYIDTLNEARKVLVDEASSTLFPIARDVKIQVEFNPSRVAEYRLIGYETRMLNRADFNNDKVDAGDIGSGHCVTAIYEITPVESDARLIDDLRYQSEQNPAPKKGGEYAFLKIRYKLPKEEKSRLMTKPIGRAQEYRRIRDVPADIRYAASVAAFGQLLRGAPYMRGFGCDDIVSLARPARGDDPFGYRSEFIGLVFAAKSAGAMPEQP